jgi:hypothetical protein
VDFPPYVPPELREFAKTYALVCERLLSLAEQRSKEYADRAPVYQDKGNHKFAGVWRELHADSNRRVKQVEARLIGLDRLLGANGSYEKDMRNAIGWLTADISDPRRWCAFFAIALGTPTDFSRFRANVDRQRNLFQEFAKKAEELAVLSHQLRDVLTDFPRPHDLSPGALRDTYAPLPEDRWLDDLLWLHGPKSGLVLAATDRWLAENFPGVAAIDVPRVGGLPGFEFAHPPLISLLDKAAWAAGQARPEDKGLFGAAVIHSQRNRKMEYLRAFGYELRARDFPITDNVMKAMAEVATVILDENKNPVELRDVKAAMKYLDKHRKDSGED